MEHVGDLKWFPFKECISDNCKRIACGTKEKRKKQITSENVDPLKRQTFANVKKCLRPYKAKRNVSRLERNSSLVNVMVKRKQNSKDQQKTYHTTRQKKKLFFRKMKTIIPMLKEDPCLYMKPKTAIYINMEGHDRVK